MRWKTPDGVVWDSKFEAEIFDAYQRAGFQVRKCGAADCLPYTSTVRGASCLQCGSGAVVQAHRYTPDLFIAAKDAGQSEAVGDGDGAYFVECKGFLRAERRSLLRAFCKAQPDLPLRLVLQRDYKVTPKLTISEWAIKYLRIPVAVWTGQPPTTWRVRE
jgi:hypothetical protein